ncbi:MAG: ankyrin repeat domain-containing protein, partial [Flavobacterium sp.]
GYTALMLATQSGNNDLVKLLVVLGAKTELCDNKGLTALEIATQQGNSEAVELLGG